MNSNESATETIEAEATVEEVANLDALLDLEQSDSVSTSEDDTGSEDAETSTKAQPKMFNDLAEATGLELDDLYNLEVTIADGETITIQELKALKGDQDDLTVRQLEIEETHAKNKSELRTAQNELAEIIAGLPEGSVNAQTLEKVRARQAARLEVEQGKALDAIPSWSDPQTREADMVAMAQHLETFGFPANHLANVTDHRMLVFIRESQRREKRIRKALDKVRAGKPNPTTSTTASPKKRGSGKPATRKNGDARNKLEQFFSDV